MITTTYDPEADALYVRLAPRDAQDTREIAPGVMLDFDARGQVIGIEVLSVRARDTAAPAAEAAE